MSQPPHHTTSAYEHLARIGKAVASPHRLRLLTLLDQAPRSVERAAQCTGLSLANTSHHLRQLRNAGLVQAEHRGTFVFYRLAGPDVSDFLATLRRLGQTFIADLQLAAEQARADAHQHIDIEDMEAAVEDDRFFIVDLRPVEEFAADHLPGAHSIPLEDLPERLQELPRDRTIILYCRGPYCSRTHKALALLREQGFTARRFDHSVSDWRRLHHPSP